MAENGSVSAGYCARMTSSWPMSSLGSGLQCLALCEVIAQKEAFKSVNVEAHNYYIVPQEDMVTTRFFIVNAKKVGFSASAVIKESKTKGRLGCLSAAS